MIYKYIYFNNKMTVYCENVLHLTGKEEYIALFIRDMVTDEGDFSFGMVRPIPADNQNLSKAALQCVNWGTPTEAVDFSMKNKSFGDVTKGNTYKRYTLRFYTAYNPPYVWFNSCMTKYPNIKIVLAYVTGHTLSYGTMIKKFESDEIIIKNQLMVPDDFTVPFKELKADHQISGNLAKFMTAYSVYGVGYVE